MLAAKPIRALVPFVFVAVALLLCGHALHQPILIYIFKPLATILILSVPLTRWVAHRSAFTLWISLGIFFSLFGDVFLMFHQTFFIHGLFAFLLAHLAYLVAFTSDVKFPARLSIFFLYLLFVLSVFVFLLPTLPSSLRLPVLVYILCLSTMAAQAMGRFFILKNSLARSAALGGLLFLLSDSFLAFDRFRSPIPAAYLYILISYYLAQWLIALSAVPNHSRTSTPVPL